MSQLTKLPVGLALLLCASLAVAQSNLGELLDAGARKLTVDEFKAELVQHLIVGQTPGGATFEIVYTNTGEIAGQGSAPGQDVPAAGTHVISGQWTTDDSGRICTSMAFDRATRAALSRCEFWFKYSEQYFLSVSDSDRQTRVLRRTIKQ